MAEIISFRSLRDRRRDAVLHLGCVLAARMNDLFDRHSIRGIPVDVYVDAMCRTLEGDPVAYDHATLTHIAASEEAMQDVEDRFIRILVNACIISTDFR